MGVRPEHVELASDGIAAKVDVSEMMGSSVHLHLTSGGNNMIMIVPTVGTEGVPAMGDDIRFRFAGNTAHVFSKETGKNLEF